MQLILTKSGKREFGIITESQAKYIGVMAGAIWLPLGKAGPRGYGHLHVESNKSRMAQLNGMGFSYFADFCEYVAGGFTKICDANRGDLSIVRRKDGFDFHLIIRWMNGAEHGGRWEIVTGVPSRVVRDRIIWP